MNYTLIKTNLSTLLDGFFDNSRYTGMIDSYGGYNNACEYEAGDQQRMWFFKGRKDICFYFPMSDDGLVFNGLYETEKGCLNTSDVFIEDINMDLIAMHGYDMYTKIAKFVEEIIKPYHDKFVHCLYAPQPDFSLIRCEPKESEVQTALEILISSFYDVDMQENDKICAFSGNIVVELQNQIDIIYLSVMYKTPKYDKEIYKLSYMVHSKESNPEGQEPPGFNHIIKPFLLSLHLQR